MDAKIASLFAKFDQRNIRGIYCPDKAAATQKLLELIPAGSSVGFSGSVTLGELGIAARLEQRGNPLFDHNRPGISREESLALRRQGAQADYYLASANALSQNGELVFLSAYGNRTAGVAYAKNVIIVCGVNKLAPDLAQALKRAREYATPLNCKRLNWEKAPCFGGGVCREGECLAPLYRRMCCQTLVIESEAMPPRMSVVVVGESMGF
jgi:hypothetical protein